MGMVKPLHPAVDEPEAWQLTLLTGAQEELHP